MMLLASHPKKEWRSPQGGDTLAMFVLAEERDPTLLQRENAAHGQVHWIGCPHVKLHGRYGWPEWPASALTSCGDKRQSADPGSRRDSPESSPMPGGRNARELAVRGAVAARGGDRGGGGGSEPGAEERQTGCLRLGGAAADRSGKAEGIQEAGRVRAAETANQSLYAAGSRLGAGAEPDQEPVPIAGPSGSWQGGVFEGEISCANRLERGPWPPTSTPQPAPLA